MQTKTLLSLLPAFLATTASACTGPPVNIPTLDLLKGFEGFHADAYDDGFGNPTIGFGHLCADPACSDVPFPKPLSDDSATKLLAGDLAVRVLPYPSFCIFIGGLFTDGLYSNTKMH